MTRAEGVLSVGILVTAAAGVIAFAGVARAEREARLEARNARAAADSGQRLILARADAAEESVAVYRRLVREGKIRLTTEERAHLNTQRTVGALRGTIALLGDSLHRLQVGSADRDSTGVVTATDSLDATDTLGVRARATVTVPPPYQVSTWTWDLRRAPITLGLLVACAEQNAVATLTGPPWLPASFTRIEQADEVCVPPVRWDPWKVELPSLPVAGSLVGVGVILGLVVGR